METLKRFWRFLKTTEELWSIIDLLLKLGFGGFIIALGLTLQQLTSPWREVILVLGIMTLGQFFYSVAIIIRAFRGNKKLTRLYENRADLPSLADDFEKAEEIWVSWRVGTVAKTFSQEIWANTRFTRLLIHHPKPAKGEPHYLKAHVLGFPNRTLNELSEDIYSATRQAPSHIDVRWFNGYLGDSLLIVNPHSSKLKFHHKLNCHLWYRKLWTRLSLLFKRGYLVFSQKEPGLVEDCFASPFQGSSMGPKL